jgi:mevalonate kinase
LKSKITASAPGKLMLFGEHAVVYGRPCIVTAVDQRIRVSVQKLTEKELQIEAPDVGILNYKKNINKIGHGNDIPKGVRFIEYAIKNFKNKFGLPSGVKIETKSDFSSKFGFGSSSAATVATLKAVSELFRVKLTMKGLFDLSYKTVLGVQGVGSGFDLAAAIWGGTIYFVTGGKKIAPLNTGKLSLVIGYTGIKADTPTLVKKVGELCKNNKKETDKIFDIIGVIVEDAKKALLKGDFKKLGSLADINQGLLDSLGVSTKELFNLTAAAREGGAYGAKLSGAGGGDCMISFVNSRYRNAARRAIRIVGGTVLDVETGAEGVRIEK